jgi:hypothetical protein
MPPNWSIDPKPIASTDKPHWEKNSDIFEQEYSLTVWQVFIEGQKHLFVTVFPSYDNILHISTVIYHYLYHESNKQPNVTLWYFPEAFRRFPFWSGLQQINVTGMIIVTGDYYYLQNSLQYRPVSPKDDVELEIEPRFLDYGLFLDAYERLLPVYAKNSNCVAHGKGIFAFMRYTSKSQQYLFLGMKDLPKGLVLAAIAKDCIERGAAGFIHVNKVSTFQEELLGKVIAPIEFLYEPLEVPTHLHLQKSSEIISIDNYATNWFPFNGIHSSLQNRYLHSPKLLKEQLQLGVTTVDTDLSYLADVINSVKKQDGFIFGAVSAVTKYHFTSGNIIQNRKSSRLPPIEELIPKLASKELNKNVSMTWLKSVHIENSLSRGAYCLTLTIGERRYWCKSMFGSVKGDIQPKQTVRRD